MESLVQQSSAKGWPEGAFAGLPEAELEAYAALLQCRHWLISPFLRALQTAAFALSPLLMRPRHPRLILQVSPQCNEVVKSRHSHDCQGKKDNVGFRVTARAVNKTAELFEFEDGSGAERPVAERQSEMIEVGRTFCSMDTTDVSQVWWSDIGQFKKEHLKLEDMRIRRLVAHLLKHEEAILGVVAHSLLFQRLLQLFCPFEFPKQEQLRVCLRNGKPTDTKDPFKDKMMNCGVLVLTFQYYELDPHATVANRTDAQIVGAQFLFGGHMESGIAADKQTVDLPNDAEEDAFDDLNEFLASAEAADVAAASQEVAQGTAEA